MAGGFITDQLSWRWILYLNVPFGLAAAIIIGIALREERSALRAPVDYLGVVTLTTSITLFMVALMQRGSSGFERGFWGFVLMMAASLLLLLLFLQIERRAQAPMLPLSLAGGSLGFFPRGKRVLCPAFFECLQALLAKCWQK